MATLASNINKQQLFWDVLSINTPANTWRATVNDESILASSHTIYDKNGKIVHQQLLSNAFNAIVMKEIDSLEMNTFLILTNPGNFNIYE